MALDKKTLNDFLPNGFETQNKTDYKANFSNDKIAVGFDKDTLEVLSGPNLNNLLDKTGKNFHTLNDFLNYFNQMPIGSFPIVNTSNQLDYKSINSFFRNVGEIVPSLIPLDDGNLRLLDGSLLENNITYARFISYMAGLRSTLPNLFTTEANWQAQVQQYGECGKFVYNTTNKTLRLPKIVTYLRGTNDSSVLGDLVEAGIPQHTHGGTTSTADKAHDHGRGTMDITGTFKLTGNEDRDGARFNGAFYNAGSNYSGERQDDYRMSIPYVGFQASRSWTGRTTSESIAHNHTFTTGNANNNTYKSGINTVNTQAIRVFYYIVVSVDEAEKQVLSAVYNYKGSVDTYEELPTDASIGEVYNVIGEDPEGYSGANFAWTGEVWDRLGGTVNLSGYLTKTEAGNIYATKASLESNVDDLQEQINTNASNIANIASQEVIAQGIKKIEALKFASTIGHGISSDTDMFAAIKKYAHSTFDRSKFPVVGSPTITADGVVSGFSASNYITIANPLIGATKYSIKAKFTLPSTISGYGYVFADTNGVTGLSIYYDSSKVMVRCASQTAVNSIGSPTANSVWEVEVIYDNGTAIVNYTKNGVSGTKTLNMTGYTDFQATNLFIGQRASGKDTAYFKGSIDLKQFSITVDGKEVFNGNKGGLDVIKPDNYTVVGSPTITEDGVASGFSDSDSIVSIFDTIAGGTDIKIRMSVKINSDDTPSGIQWLFAFFETNSSTTQKGYLQYQKSSKKLVSAIASTGYKAGNTILNLNEWYDIEYQTDLSTYYRIYINGVLDNESIFSTPITNYQLSKISLGNVLSGSSYIRGSIDLNAFRIYVDGQLVYQPCLKIPYKLSNTNLKITQEMNRAIDMADQCGYSQYFGLNESDMTCLVPQGDNITGRRDLVHREEDITTHYVTEKYSDLYCKQMASCTANTAVTFAQPYKDEYYKLSVPYSAKTRTGFTPTVSGDWTAEGYTYLT